MGGSVVEGEVEQSVKVYDEWKGNGVCVCVRERQRQREREREKKGEILRQDNLDFFDNKLWTWPLLATC